MNVATARVGVLVSILRIEPLFVALLNVVVAEGGGAVKGPGVGFAGALELSGELHMNRDVAFG